MKNQQNIHIGYISNETLPLSTLLTTVKKQIGLNSCTDLSFGQRGGPNGLIQLSDLSRRSSNQGGAGVSYGLTTSITECCCFAIHLDTVIKQQKIQLINTMHISLRCVRCW